MKFTYANQEYRIAFAHPVITKGTGKKQHVKRQTIARIYTGERNTPDEVLVAEGIVNLYVGAQFCYEAGRRGAIKKALCAPYVPFSLAEFMLAGILDSSQTFNRAFRTAVWKAYHSRTGGLFEAQQTASGNV
jgi:hypothetical protein